jgi:hypothetical protein
MKKFFPVAAFVLLALASCTPIQGQPVSEYVANENFHTLSSCFMRNIQNNQSVYDAGASLTPLVNPLTDRVDGAISGQTVWRIDFMPQGSRSLIFVSAMPMVYGPDYRWKNIIKPALDPCTQYEPVASP